MEAEISSWNLPGIVAPRRTTVCQYPELYHSPAWSGKRFEAGLEHLLLVQEMDLMRGGDLAQGLASTQVSAAAAASYRQRLQHPCACIAAA